MDFLEIDSTRVGDGGIADGVCKGTPAPAITLSASLNVPSTIATGAHTRGHLKSSERVLIKFAVG